MDLAAEARTPRRFFLHFRNSTPTGTRENLSAKSSLHDIASQLGADVPFFLKKIPSYATGKGEILQPIKYSVGKYILTVVPEISVPTPLAYSMVTPIEDPLRGTGTKNKTLCDLLFDPVQNISSYRDVIVNDFETAVFEKFPVIAEIKSELYHHGAEFALMSGSGSSVYGFFATEELARKTSEVLTNKFKLRATDITPP